MKKCATEIYSNIVKSNIGELVNTRYKNGMAI